MLPAALSPPASAAASPVLSGSSDNQLPHPRRTSSTRTRDSFVEAAQQEKALQSDPKYRKFASSVDKTLQSFDQVNEWADFITFLAKLLKTLQAYPQFAVIPHKLIVAKRLSQCLNPALPTGVHQRALDVYTHILTTIGPANLRRDLPAWSSGLFPFFQYAATSVKHLVLNIYERFYLPLQESLRPATKAFILALLPGLEEEAGEWFEKVAALLDRVSGTVSPSFFFQNLWLVLITAPNSRIPALNYLARRLPRMEEGESASPSFSPSEIAPTLLSPQTGLTQIVGQDVGLMVRGFASALQDPQILVQRGILDLLTTTLKLDSAGFKNTRREDQVLLVRSVIGVVLRRDLSLSRRLYTWLLSSQDSSDEQSAYLRAHGLGLLHDALKAEMEAAASSEERKRQRPFKIFISLLDKWEIGAQLTEALVLESFEALRGTLRPGDEHDELLMTGNMLFEVLDPFLLWKQVYRSIKSEMHDGQADSATKLARFIVKTFRLHDEEVQRLHAPITAFALLDLVEASLADPFPTTLASPAAFPSPLPGVLQLAGDLLREVPSRFFHASPAGTPEPLPPLSARSLADSLYGAEDVKAASLPETEGRELLAAGIASVLRTMQAWAQSLVRADDAARDEATSPRQVFLEAVTVLERLVQLGATDADVPSSPHLVLAWSPGTWLDGVVRCFTSVPATILNFDLHSAIVRSIVAISDSSGALHPAPSAGTRTVMAALVSKLLDYLQPSTAPWYLEAVQLLWAVEALAPQRGYLESFIAAKLTAPDRNQRLEAFEAFGTLWRFTEDGQLPGVVLRSPMFTTLDSLKSDDLSTRRAAEAWMRCSLKSYIRILDPLLFSLLDPTVQLRDNLGKVGDVRVPTLVYERAFDQSRIHHVLDNLLALARFGGQGFIRIAKGSFLKHTFDPSLRERVLAADLDTYTYLDGIVVVLLRLLRADPDAHLRDALGPYNAHIHSVVAELLQVLISRGEAELSTLPSIEAALLSRLFQSVHQNELDLQNKLLHVLHSVIFSLANVPRRQLPASSTPAAPEKPAAADGLPPDLTRDEFFVRLLQDAVAQSNNAVLHHWIDFLLMTIPQIRHRLHSVVLPLIDRLVSHLGSLVNEIRSTYSVATAPSQPSSVTDAEYTAVTNALERLLLVAVTEATAGAVDDDARSVERTGSEGAASGAGSSSAGGLLGYMTGVLSQPEAEPADVPEEIKTKHQTLQRINDVVELLLETWEATSLLENESEDDRASSQGYFAVRAKVRARRALERIYRAAPSDVLNSIIAFWGRDPDTPTNGGQARLFSALSILSPSPQLVVSALCEKFSFKQAAKHRSPLAPSDSAIFTFFEAYVEQLEPAAAVQVWSTTLSLSREVLNTASVSRSSVFPVFRCFTAVAEKVSQTSALEDRRLRRDLQETFIRLSDAAIQLAGRAAESGSWLRKAAPEGSVANDETASITSHRTKDSAATEIDTRAVPQERQFVREVADFLSKRAFQDFRRFLIDNDKTLAVCSNAVYYIVTPVFKTRAKAFDPDPAVFRLLEEMSKNPQTLKAWRSVVNDAFFDNRFFNASPAANARWKHLVQALMQSDKERLSDLIGKISAASSANIFTNRELESLSRALSLRRLTYVLLTGDKDRYLGQLPLIQEKLVDLLRSNVGDMVYLCLRVLFCRIDNQHLSGLWPVLLTELLRLFDSVLEQKVLDGSDALQLVLSACKFLDLTLVLQTEDFQIHEWMFVTDTVDAIYPPDSWLPQAIMDRLGDILSDPHLAKRVDASILSSSPSLSSPAVRGDASAARAAEARRPLIAARRITSIADLEPFFASISLAAYESVYKAGTRVDWSAVERSLERDLFEGELVRGV
ncbi:hypothetical protein JCM6882_002446 [Rhodosporidiobolus microsporus]